MKITRGWGVAALAAAAAMVLGGCAAGDGGGPVIAPVTMSANDLQGATVDLVVGQVLNITTGDLAVDSYNGTVADTSVATFVKGDAGAADGGADLNPGVTALAAGETSVVLANTGGGIQDVTFTVVVAERTD